MAFESRTVGACLISLLMAAACFAQQPCRREISVTAVRPDGKLLQGLSPQSFKLKVQGRELPVVSVERSTQARVVVVLDGSGSMQPLEDQGFGPQQPPTFWPLLVESAVTLVQSLPKNVEMAFVSFGGGVNMTVPFGADRVSALQKIAALKEAELKTPSKTPLWQSIQGAVSMLQPARVGDTIIVLSDGGDNASKEEFDDLERNALSAGTRIFSIVPVSVPVRTDEELSGVKEMAQLSLNTGGESEQFARPGRAKADLARQLLLTAVHDVVVLAFEGYRLEFDMMPSSRTTVKLSLELVYASGQRIKAKLLYPHRVSVCSNH